MKMYENGDYREMTAEEIAALEQEESQPTLEERLAALEALLAEKEGM